MRRARPEAEAARLLRRRPGVGLMFMFCHAEAALRAVIGCFLRLESQELNGVVVVL